MTINTLQLTLEDAKIIAAGAEAEAKRHQWPVVIAIVDDGGHLLFLQRLDDAQYGSIAVAIEKARAAIAFRRPTKIWEDHVAEGHVRYLNLPGTLPIEGGLPILINQQYIGAVGVSGVRSFQDAQIAQAGINALLS
ncbi:heme-binding protein [Nitrosomonas sp. JL21]|uniref:GlcG/HbpS family heme-binding protein n=1 Tax=Nitrosomonas sp. JL21 TaxID=153949 RepID=UPI00136B2EF1|nr:heme-binding protein [Nitrosomonas sp. JL21]MBL8496737.1 heme-binding protein [Nitrosomonas sp.]MCC7092230.1 heme-binding protein [Nitrosomonas sp.]MXS76524.1 heme-binding protein [Nitrosomonas sp. JL21]